jgi:hypothetical protein
MCDHSESTYPIKKTTDLKLEPKDAGNCHIYYVHQEGTILCEPNVKFDNGQAPRTEVTSLNDRDKIKHNPSCGEDRLTLMYVQTRI